MSKSGRPAYGGIPARAKAEVAARRQRIEDVQAAASPPPASPLTVEARLKAVEKQLAALAGKIDLMLDILRASDPSNDDLPRRAKKGCLFMDGNFVFFFSLLVVGFGSAWMISRAARQTGRRSSTSWGDGGAVGGSSDGHGHHGGHHSGDGEGHGGGFDGGGGHGGGDGGGGGGGDGGGSGH